MSAPSRILIIQLRRIGDVLLATPIIRELRRAFPLAHISFLVEAPFEPLVRRNPYIDEVVVTNRRQSLRKDVAMIARLRQSHFDLSIDLLGKPRTVLWSWLIGAYRRIGFASRECGFLFTDSVSPGSPDAYSVLHKAALLEPLGIDVVDLRPEFRIGVNARSAVVDQLRAWHLGSSARLVAVAPGSRREEKRWPGDRFAAIADRLVERHGVVPVFVCGPGEESQVEVTRASMHSPSCFASDERPPLDQVQALLERCCLFVGNDTGLRHMAVAAGVPSVAVFGQPRSCNWTPPDDLRHRSVESDPGCKLACTFPDCGRECLLDVSVDDVWKVVEGVWEASGRERLAATLGAGLVSVDNGGAGDA